MSGIMEEILTQRYGAPSVVATDELREYRWNQDNEPLSCVLYKALSPSAIRRPDTDVCSRIYGDVLGGFLYLDSLRLAMRAGPVVYGLYDIQSLWSQPEVRDANRMDPAIRFFMDAANVWFYGIKGDDVYVYDAEMAELTRLGVVVEAFQRVLDEWEESPEIKEWKARKGDYAKKLGEGGQRT